MAGQDTRFDVFKFVALRPPVTPSTRLATTIHASGARGPRTHGETRGLVLSHTLGRDPLRVLRTVDAAKVKSAEQSATGGSSSASPTS
jgi:hypothetical protein